MVALIFYTAMKKVIILVDGQNLYYSLKSISLVEKDIKWNLLFNSFLSDGEELVRSYWFRPQKILDTYFTNHNIRNTIVGRKYKNYSQDYRNNQSTIPPNVLAQIEQDAVEVEKWLNEEKVKFQSIEYNYDKLCLEFDDLEIVKTGILKVNPYNKEYLGEKGVDISLAVKMISLSVEKKCDKIILVSGDYDYAEAIKFVKNNMTKIHIVKMHKGVPPKNRGMSRDLSILADKIIDVYEADLRGKYLK